MSFPKKGKFLPGGGHSGSAPSERSGSFATEISAALHRSAETSGAGVKVVANWTGANERTVKNWFSGRYAPSGEHLTILVRQSDEVLSAFLVLAGRKELLVAVKLALAEDAVLELLAAVRAFTDPAHEKDH
jgi:hypothetical protein